ncbi:MAG: N-acetylmuramic acid 6-phosphate etherase, partial [Verrucomicrobiota bacterium]
LNQRITPLAEEILRTLGLSRLQDLVEWAMQADKMSVARLAPCIFHAARFGEPEMLNVVQSGASMLAEFTRAVAQRLEFHEVPVRLVGGLFAHHPDYVSLYKYRLSILLPKATVELCTESGALGAAWLAQEQAGEGLLPQGREKMEAPIGKVDTGLPEDATALASASTEQSNPRSSHLEKLSTGDLVNLFVSEERFVDQALAAVSQPLVRAVDLVSSAMRGGGRLFYVGAGTSGRLGVLDASEIPPTFGMPPERVQGIIAGGITALHRAVEGAEDQPDIGALAMLERGVRTGDAVCGIAASGRTPYVLGALAKARELGAVTILLTCNPARPASARPWDVEVDLPTGPEIITGSTRLKAGTATKLVLNILSTCAMIRLGKVRGNSMIDLNVSNLKLRDRGIRLVSRELNLPYDEARTRLEKAQWNVRACLEAGDSSSAEEGKSSVAEGVGV